MFSAAIVPFLKIVKTLCLSVEVPLPIDNKYAELETLYVPNADSFSEEVTKLLPGYNCGACGFPGCSGFADAIVNGKVDRLNHCKPGKEDKNFKPILEFLKQSDEEIEKKLKLK
jgi:Na+-translocating ferredoxin:NAD+ oxidoreductase RNF subunit RnfB